MPYRSRNYVASLDETQRAQLLATHTILGFHPETRDALCIPERDRYAGMYIVGVQGTGKSGLIENLIAQDIRHNRSVIVLDPHADLTTHCIAQLPPEQLHKTYLDE